MPSTTAQGSAAFSPSSKVRTNGLFADGVWHCNCEPRLPANRLRTQNGGPNHGRWFYACQKSNGCRFFLWADTAKAREAKAVLSNSRSEPTAPATPSRAVPSGATATPTRLSAQRPPLTPPSWHKASAPAVPEVRSTTRRAPSPDFLADLPSSDDDALTAAVEKAEAMAPPARPLPETPRKATKTNAAASPGRQSFYPQLGKNSAGRDRDEDVFWTPRPGEQSRGPLPLGRAAGLMSPEETPAADRFVRYPQVAEPSSPTLQRRASKEMFSSQIYELDSTPSVGIHSSPPVALAEHDSYQTTTSTDDGELKVTPMGAEMLDLLRELDVESTRGRAVAIAALGARFDRRLQQMRQGRDVSREAVKRREARLADMGKALAQVQAENANYKQITSTLRNKVAKLEAERG